MVVAWFTNLDVCTGFVHFLRIVFIPNFYQMTFPRETTNRLIFKTNKISNAGSCTSTE